ncbi:MAG: hypothetical protein ACR2QX_04635 [Woeseiaceae bacterium]
MILSMPAAFILRIVAAGLWLLIGGYDILRQRRAHTQYCGVRLDFEGRLELKIQGGDWVPARMLPGSIVLRHLGWIRIRDERGHVFAEPVRGHCRDSRDWRRLQVIWRHIGAHS